MKKKLPYYTARKVLPFFNTSILGRNRRSYAGFPRIFNERHGHLLPRNIHGEFTYDLSKLFFVFVFPHLVFT